MMWDAVRRDQPGGARGKWAGEDADALSAKITQAVADTDGMAVCYEGAPIQALFHAASAAFTRSAAEVFGEELPLPSRAWKVPRGTRCPTITVWSRSLHRVCGKPDRRRARCNLFRETAPGGSARPSTTRRG